MNKLDKQLTVLYLSTILLALGIYLYFEFVSPLEVAPLAGIANFQNVQYICEVVTDLLAIGFVYLALKLMVLGTVRRSLQTSADNYGRWAIVRWAMLSVVILLGLGVHYLFLSPSTVGCPIIGALALLFVWPTKGRRESEVNRSE